MRLASISASISKVIFSVWLTDLVLIFILSNSVLENVTLVNGAGAGTARVYQAYHDHDDHDDHDLEGHGAEYYMYDASGQLVQLVEKKTAKTHTECTVVYKDSWFSWWWAAPCIVLVALPLLALPFMIQFQGPGQGGGGGGGGGGGWGQQGWGGWGGSSGQGGQGGGGGGYLEIWGRHNVDENNKVQSESGSGSSSGSGSGSGSGSKRMTSNVTMTTLDDLAKWDPSFFKDKYGDSGSDSGEDDRNLPAAAVKSQKTKGCSNGDKSKKCKRKQQTTKTKSKDKSKRKS